MFKDDKHKQKTVRDLIADPFAEEKHWLPTCENLRTDISPVHPRKAGILRLGQLLFALFMSAAIAFVYTIVIDAGYDWGYGLIEKFWDQPNGTEQGLWALSSIGLIMIPGAFGLAFGAVRSHFNRIEKTWSRAPFILLAAVATALISLICFGANSSDSDLFWAFGFNIAVSFASLAAGLRIGAWTYSGLKKRIDAPQMFVWSSSALLPFAILIFVRWNFSLSGECIGYFLSILIGSAIAACAAKSKDKIAGIIAGCFAMLPIFLANFFNLASNILSGALDSLEWRALASAVALNLVAISAVYLGSTVAIILRKSKLWRHHVSPKFSRE